MSPVQAEYKYINVIELLKIPSPLARVNCSRLLGGLSKVILRGPQHSPPIG